VFFDYFDYILLKKIQFFKSLLKYAKNKQKKNNFYLYMNDCMNSNTIKVNNRHKILKECHNH
jgi:hypothetical protein